MPALLPPGVEGDQVPAARGPVQAVPVRDAGDVRDRQHRSTGGVIAIPRLRRRVELGRTGMPESAPRLVDTDTHAVVLTGHVGEHVGGGLIVHARQDEFFGEQGEGAFGGLAPAGAGLGAVLEGDHQMQALSTGLGHDVGQRDGGGVSGLIQHERDRLRATWVAANTSAFIDVETTAA